MKKSTRILIKILLCMAAFGLFILSAVSVPGFDSLLFLAAAALMAPIDEWWEVQERWFRGKVRRLIVIVAVVAVGFGLSAMEVPNSEKQYDLEEFIQQEMENGSSAADTVISDKTVE